MKTNKKVNHVVVSAIIEAYDTDGNNVLGFTVQNTDGSFENILMRFNSQNKEIVYQDLNKLRESKLSIK